MEDRCEVVSLEYRVNKAFEGKYFMGHTPLLTMCGKTNAWGGLINPPGSGVNLYVNTFTVSNYSTTSLRAQLWLNSPITGMTSPFVSPSNTTIPLLKPKTFVMYGNVNGTLTDGVSIFSRVVEANSTTVGNYYGKIIIPPGGSFLVFLYSPVTQLANAEVAFGWWEEKR